MAATNAVERMIDLIELMVDHPQGIALSEIARQLGLAKSATHRLLSSLVRHRFVEQPPGREIYKLGLKLPALGFRYISRTGVLDVAQPVLDRLAQDTGELVRLTLADDDRLVWVAIAQGARHGLRYDPDMGSPVVLHATAPGRAWLATIPEDAAIRLVERCGFAVPAHFGRQKIGTTPDLVAELDRTRQRGYAVAVEEGEPGASTVAMPIAVPGMTSGTISVTGPVMRMSAERLEELVPSLASAAEELATIWPANLLRGAANNAVGKQG